FLLVGFNQPTAHAGKGVFGLLALGDVITRADVTRERIVSAESRHAVVENPAILSVMPAKAILYLERLAPTEILNLMVQSPLSIVGMGSLRPAISQLFLKGAAGEFQAGLVEIGE